MHRRISRTIALVTFLLGLPLIACDPRPLPVIVDRIGPGVGGAVGSGGTGAGGGGGVAVGAGGGGGMAPVDCSNVDDVCSCVARQGAEPLAGVAPECAAQADPFVVSVNSCLDCRVTPSVSSMAVVVGNRGGKPTTGMKLIVQPLGPGTIRGEEIALPDPIAAGALSVVSFPFLYDGAVNIQLVLDDPKVDCVPVNDTVQLRSRPFTCP